MIENSKEGLIMTIRRKCKDDNENNGEDNDGVIYRGGYDEEMNRNGYGIEYDMENGKQKRGGVNMNENWYLNGKVGSIRSMIVYKNGAMKSKSILSLLID